MIPGVLVDFLERASVGVAGTRDAALVPYVHWVSGWRVEPGGEDVLCLIPAGFDDGLIARLEENGRIALTCEIIGPHETYQFKGRFRDWRRAGPGDRPLYESCRERYVRDAKKLLGDRLPEAMLRAGSPEPALAIRFAVEEVFVQTPGPAAGRRLFPRQEP